MSEHRIELSRRTFLFGAASVAALGSTLLSNPLKAFADPTIDQKKAEANAALESLNVLQGQFEAAETTYTQAVMEQQGAQAKMNEAQGRIDEASSRISALQSQLGDRARSMYRNGSFSVLDLLLGSTTFQAFTQNWDLLNTMNKEDADKVSETKSLKAEVQAQKATYEEQERVAREKAQAAEAATREAEAAIGQQQALYNSLSAEVAALVQQEQAAKAAQEAANANQVVQQSAQSAPQNSSSSSSPSQNNSNGNSNSSSGNNGGGSSSSSGSAPSYNASTGNAVVARAYAELGKPYGWGAVGPNSYDCSGFVSYCLTGRHERLGTTYTFMEWPTARDPQPGDVAVRSEHTGIYIGNGQMIHASTYGVGVIVGPVQSSMKIVRPPW